MQYLEPYEKDTGFLFGQPMWMVIAILSGTGLALLIVLILWCKHCGCNCCASCCKGSAQDKKSRPKSAYGNGSFELTYGDDML